MRSIEVIVRLIIRMENTILLCRSKQDKDYYFLHGGHVEFGETFEETIYKEMGEEIGLKKEHIKKITFKSYLENMFVENSDRHHELNMIFSIKIDEDIKVISQEKHIVFEWVAMNDLKNIKILPGAIVSLLSLSNEI
jgi:ADP-ribose pyrophosphatase YjhB (NUDIX family)